MNDHKYAIYSDSDSDSVSDSDYDSDSSDGFDETPETLEIRRKIIEMGNKLDKAVAKDNNEKVVKYKRKMKKLEYEYDVKTKEIIMQRDAEREARRDGRKVEDVLKEYKDAIAEADALRARNAEAKKMGKVVVEKEKPPVNQEEIIKQRKREEELVKIFEKALGVKSPKKSSPSAPLKSLKKTKNPVKAKKTVNKAVYCKEVGGTRVNRCIKTNDISLKSDKCLLNEKTNRCSVLKKSKPVKPPIKPLVSKTLKKEKSPVKAKKTVNKGVYCKEWKSSKGHTLCKKTDDESLNSQKCIVNEKTNRCNLGK